MDLEPYFQRIGYVGSRTPNLATLHALTRAHTTTIPFENLDVLLGRRISLEPDALMQKLVHDRRGGYCFEQNGLFLAVLQEMGFDARPLSARVRIDRPRDYTPPRTHIFVRVELEGESFLTDVGVGAHSLTGAIRLNTETPQETPHETRRIVKEDGRWFHQMLMGGEWKDICEFTLEEMPMIDRELGNWFTSAHPVSHFRNRLIVARASDNGERHTLLNDELKVRDREGKATVTKLGSRAELLSALRSRFGLEFSPETRFVEGATVSPTPWPND